MPGSTMQLWAIETCLVNQKYIYVGCYYSSMLEHQLPLMLDTDEQLYPELNVKDMYGLKNSKVITPKHNWLKILISELFLF